MQVPTRTVSTTGNTGTVTLSATRSSTYTSYSGQTRISLPATSYDPWTSNADGTYTITLSYSPAAWALITSITNITFNSAIADDVISYTYSISGNTITYTIIASNNPRSFSVTCYASGYSYLVSAASASYTFSELPSDITFTGIVRTSGTSYSSYSTSGNTVTLTWSSYYSGTEVSGTVSWTGYLTYESTKTYANVYFNGTLVDYVYFNGTRYPQ